MWRCSYPSVARAVAECGLPGLTAGGCLAAALPGGAGGTACAFLKVGATTCSDPYEEYWRTVPADAGRMRRRSDPITGCADASGGHRDAERGLAGFGASSTRGVARAGGEGGGGGLDRSVWRWICRRGWMTLACATKVDGKAKAGPGPRGSPTTSLREWTSSSSSRCLHATTPASRAGPHAGVVRLRAASMAGLRARRSRALRVS